MARQQVTWMGGAASATLEWSLLSLDLTMHESSTNNLDDSRLRRLFWLRNVSIALQVAALVVATTILEMDLPLAALASIVALLVSANIVTAWRLKRQMIASDFGIFAELGVDVVLLSAMLYLTGGAANPFVSLYLLPLTIAATVLPARYTWTMAGLTVAAYTLLLFRFQPLGGHDHSHQAAAFGLHVLGMWFNFIASAGLIAFFVGRMSHALRERDAELAAARERALRDQHLVVLGTFAAGAAHELGTPLSTMAVILNDLERGHAAGKVAMGQDLQTLRSQVDACKSILSDLVDRAGQARAEQVRLMGLSELIDDAAQRWQLLRPESNVAVSFTGEGVLPTVAAEETMVQALVSLLNNAADASPERVELICHWTPQDVTLEIHDQGAGLTEHARQLAGRVAYSEKPGRGLGLGLLLARATIERLGGRIDWRNRNDGGAATRVTLPNMAEARA